MKGLILVTVLCALIVLSQPSYGKDTPLTLDVAIKTAINNDPWLQGNSWQQRVTEYRGVANSSQPDPTMSLSFANVPTDTFSFSQEAMTQIKVGVSQSFARGDSLQLKQDQALLKSGKYPLLATNRKAQLQQEITLLWLDIYYSQQSIKLIEQDKELLEQTVAVVQASYSNAVGKTRQQDVLRSQLELIKMDDRLSQQWQLLESALAKLNGLLYDQQSGSNQSSSLFGFNASHLEADLPSFILPMDKLTSGEQLNTPWLIQHLQNHPLVKVIDVNQQVAAKSIEISKQAYQPKWGLNASYGYRDENAMGQPLADFFSVGVSFDLPLFTSNRQDKTIQATTAKSEAIKTDKMLLIRQLITQVENEYRQYARLNQRLDLYRNKILSHSHQQAEAALTAYTNDDGEFSEVVSARISLLNSRILALKIEVDKVKTMAKLQYLLTQPQTTKNN